MTDKSEQRVQTTCLLILTFIAAGVALYLLRSVLVPFVLAIFLVILLRPVIDWQVRHLRLPSGLALVTTLVLGAFLLFGLGVVIANSVADLSESGDEYSKRLGELQTKATDFVEGLGIDVDDGVESLMAKLPGMARNAIGTAADGLMAAASQGVLVLIFMGFLLAGSGGTPTGTAQRVHEGVKSYLTVQIAMSVLTAVLVYIVLALCNVPLALLWALLTFVLNFIPNIGSVLANILPIPVILLSPEVRAPVVAIVVPVVIQFVVGNVVQPKFMGKSVGLHPITILMALIFWGMLWGFVGMLLSIPLTLTMRILLAQSEYTKPVADAMAGQLGELEKAPTTA